MKPTESELEILQVLWDKQPCTVREVHESLKRKDIGYTTTLKLMQIMLEKSMVIRDTSSKSHLYSTTINKETIEQQFLDRMIDNIYKGNTSRLVMQALGTHKASKEEIELIKEYLDKLQ
ncbi:BlaI/MecI/CopY family transcriptional regulator [Sphingobacterium composti Ten et al. 2007 non Yoo et al. 2007]|uniref:BlaI/MecI/CopY family transcriptional regulator n=1 Tax=Sphingobacterium composti TaxID=363260 RepID=UPI00135CB434|nr:BlaI/MecI/CopY family transcriptional regulator [Sphingobacterium composti Ten et al. 2007 non Yoo et al. 2007]